MSTLAVALAILCAVLVFVVPRKWAVFVLLLAALYVPRSQIVTIASANFQVIRLIVPLAVLRVLLRGERMKGPLVPLDRMMLLWSGWLCFSELLRTGAISMVRFGDVYTILGSYFLFRVFVHDANDIQRIFKYAGLLLAPIALLMLYEHVSGVNLAASLFNDASEVMARKGRFRARGLYANAILAGTVAAVFLPMSLYLWLQSKGFAALLFISTATMVVASSSSGPAITALAGLGATAFWKYRHNLRLIRNVFLITIIALQFVMSRPVYYLVARIDVGGGSTGWYRAKLIDGALSHWNEWILIGTDQTQHWVPEGTSGVTGAHADITNHFIQMGVWGGVVLAFLFIRILFLAFGQIKRSLRSYFNRPLREQFLLWTLGSILFAHTVTFFSVSYFDPAILVLFYLLLALIAGLRSMENMPKASVATHQTCASFAN